MEPAAERSASARQASASSSNASSDSKKETRKFTSLTVELGAFGGPQCYRSNGQPAVERAGSGEHGRVHDVQPFHIMRAAVAVHDGVARVMAHARGAHIVEIGFHLRRKYFVSRGPE